MRFRTLVGGLVFLGLLGWGAWTLVGMGSSYFAAQELVEYALQQAGSRRRAGAASGTAPTMESLAEEVRAAVLTGVRRTQLQIREDHVWVLPDPGGGLRVQLRWSFPVLTLGQEVYLAIPMSLDRIHRLP